MVPAYEGKKPYIFVSYAHADSELVLPVIDVGDTNEIEKVVNKFINENKFNFAFNYDCRNLINDDRNYIRSMDNAFWEVSESAKMNKIDGASQVVDEIVKSIEPTVEIFGAFVQSYIFIVKRGDSN